MAAQIIPNTAFTNIFDMGVMSMGNYHPINSNRRATVNQCRLHDQALYTLKFLALYYHISKRITVDELLHDDICRSVYLPPIPRKSFNDETHKRFSVLRSGKGAK